MIDDPFVAQLSRRLSDAQIEHRVAALERRRRRGRLNQSERRVLAALLAETRRRRTITPIEASPTERIGRGRDPKPDTEVPNHGHPTKPGRAP